MSYNSFIYLFVFLAVAWGAWAVLPQRGRPFVLLAASMVFYLVSARQYVLYILAVAAVAWAVGQQLARLDALFAAAKPDLAAPARKAMKKQVASLKKFTVGFGAVLSVAALLAVKYLPFAVRVWNALAAWLPGSPSLAVPSFVQPLGLSFFTLMAVSYVVDVYRGACAPAAHYWQVLLFLGFWPHVVEGPFDRYGALAPALFDPPRPSYRSLTFGVQRILWGLFKKMVIADRAYMCVKAVFDDWVQYSGAAVALGTLLYTLELYAEFSGCMDIVCGSAEMFGVPLAENFRQPFFSRSVGEFWRRWHITLGAWLREYVFQPACAQQAYAEVYPVLPRQIRPCGGAAVAGLGGARRDLGVDRAVAWRGVYLSAVRPVLLCAAVAWRAGRTAAAESAARPACLAAKTGVPPVADCAHVWACLLRYAAVPRQRCARCGGYAGFALSALWKKPAHQA